MNRCRLIALLMVLPLQFAAAAGQPVDGIYFSARGAPAPQIQTQDGKTLFLGARRDLKISVEGNRVAANDNANTTFWLNIRFPNDGTVSPGTGGLDSHVLLVAGTAYRLKGYGTSGDGTASMSFAISGDANAKLVAKYFSVPVTYLRHPGHRLSTSFTPAKPSFARGETVTVTFRMVNLGTEVIAFYNNHCEGDYAHRGDFIFAAYRNGRSIPDIDDISKVHPCGVTVGSLKSTLQPGATFERTVNLGRWFDLGERGSYQIQGSRGLSFVEPNERIPNLIWTDFVGASFTFTIE